MEQVMANEKILYNELKQVPFKPLTTGQIIKDTDDAMVVLQELSHYGLVIVKYQKANADFNTILHEGIVGLYTVNNLHNFVHILGVYLNVTYPKIGNCDAVIYEYVNGETLTSFLRKNPATVEVKHILLQIFVALYNAYKLYDFTHYDLHTDNVIVKISASSVACNYNGKTLFHTHIVPIIIDYGRAHVRIGGIDYGYSYPRDEIGVDPAYVENHGFWAHDMFSLLSTIYSEFSLTGALAKAKNELDEYVEYEGNTVYTMNQTEDVEEQNKQIEAVKFWQDEQMEAKQKIAQIEGTFSLENKELEAISMALMELIIGGPFDFRQLLKDIGPFAHLRPELLKVNVHQFMEVAVNTLL